ncbi:MAG: hypothetical protein K2K12_02395 [Clostridia bacterium]|nr:hypothetical protein [Clostridia bacterium]
MKKFLTATVCAMFALGCACAFAGCGTDYSDDIKDLQKQIQELENKNNSLQIELNALKNNNYTTEITALKNQITSLQAQVNSLKTSNTTLTNSLNAAKLRLDAVEGAMQADKNYTYQMGEVCTVKSASGIELYKVRLIKYDIQTEGYDSYCLYLNVQRINLPQYLSLNQFVNFAMYDDTTDTFYHQINDLPNFADTTDNFEQEYKIGFSSNLMPTHFYVGLPWDNTLSDSTSRKYIIPYGIYAL